MKLLTLIFALVLSLSLHSAFAPKKKDLITFYDADWKPTKEKKAVYLMRVHITEEGNVQNSYYNMYGPLIRIETFQDEQSKVRNGLYAWYDPKGIADSSGYYFMGLPDKTWVYLDQDGDVQRYVVYDKGVFIKETIVPPGKGRVLHDWSDKTKGQFPGGAPAWAKYLKKNLSYPDRAFKNDIQGRVHISCKVDTSGHLGNFRLFKSVEMSLDDEAVLILRNSPDWIPGTKDGKTIESYCIQPVYYEIPKGFR